MLAYAVANGTGTNAQIAGYQVAGKTGTARIPLPHRAGYMEDKYVASFIGYLPAGDPRVVIAAILDRPAQEYGGLAAAPLFQRVARAAIARLGIEPTEYLPPPPLALPAG
jgi:cell division protein FtsI/penicillin-binding protein 2